jgi:glycerol-3-phosphate dehydrogenase
VNRADLLAMAAAGDTWDVVVIGGGATGLGVAVESAARGYTTLLLEQSDFAKGTSSRSTKLVHGGVRYLQQGDVSLVLEALHERGLLIQNAPHLVHHLPFVVPVYDWWEGPFYGIGLKLYDALAGRLGLGPSRNLSREETLERIPTVEPDGLRGGVIYYDGQFDDSRLAVTLACTLADLGGTPLNYVRVTGLLRSDRGGTGAIEGVRAVDEESGREMEIRARVVVNATGVFTDQVRRMDDPGAGSMVTASQGVHIVLDRTFLPGDSAIMVPHTSDGRVLFAVPWHGRVIVGTTDTPVPEASLEPRALDEEVEFLLTHAIRYLTRDPLASDVLSVFAGLRPLVGSPDSETKAISRDHTLVVSPSGLVTITGGKWTTYRRMGADTVTQAAIVAGLPERESGTEHLKLHGWTNEVDPTEPWSVYGTDWLDLEALERARSELAHRLHPSLPYRASEVVWAARFELARTVEDVLSRRLRALLLDARASVEMAPRVAELLAEELGHGSAWEEGQVAAYTELAQGYVLG